MGTDETRGGICVCPALNAWMGEQLHKEGLAAKEQREAREEKALLKKGNKKEYLVLFLRTIWVVSVTYPPAEFSLLSYFL